MKVWKSNPRIRGPRAAAAGRRWLGRLLLLALLAGRPAAASAQGAPGGPQTDVASYRIAARLAPDSHQVLGRERITYRNPAPDALGEVWLHLYLNAFRAPDTLWLREAGGTHRRNPADPAHLGWIRIERVALADGTELPPPTEGDPDQTTVRLPLPRPLGPGEALELDLAWTAQLPRVFARTGYAGDFFMVGQWYPKLAVYDRGQWDREPWHANAEFFADFGTYDLELSVPAGYQTGASGVRLEETANPDGTLTARYRAERVTDVAWAASPGLRRLTRWIEAADRPVELELLLPPDEAESDRFFEAAGLALDAYGRWYGAYPWPRLTLLVPPGGAEGAGGMEYPSLVTLERSPGLPFGLDRGLREVEIVTLHEIAHQWFPLQVQSNEAAEPFLDEAFADYLTMRLLEQRWPADRAALDTPFLRLGYAEAWRLVAVAGNPRDPLDRSARAYSPAGYGATIYAKGSLSLLSLERALGAERFTAALRAYADRWRWRHPTIADLQAELEAALGEPLGWYFDGLVRGSALVDYGVAELGPDRATVERRGEASFPVDLRLDFADGSSEVRRWDGAGLRLELADRVRPVVGIAIDPDQRLAIELERLDNARRAAPDTPAALAAANRWLGLLQALLQLLGQLG